MHNSTVKICMIWFSVILFLYVQYFLRILLSVIKIFMILSLQYRFLYIAIKIKLTVYFKLKEKQHFLGHKQTHVLSDIYHKEVGSNNNFKQAEKLIKSTSHFGRREKNSRGLYSLIKLKIKMILKFSFLLMLSI